MEVSSLVHIPVTLLPGERAPSTYWTGGSVGHIAGRDAVTMRKIAPLPRIESRSPARGLVPILTKLSDFQVLYKYSVQFWLLSVRSETNPKN
jgi:hypothetical protein